MREERARRTEYEVKKEKKRKEVGIRKTKDFVGESVTVERF